MFSKYFQVNLIFLMINVAFMTAAFGATQSPDLIPGLSDNWYHYNQGMEMLQIKSYDQAQREFDYYLKHPEIHKHMFGIAHFGRGLMFQSMGNIGQAITEFNLAIQNDLHPAMRISENAHMNLGAIYMKRKAYTEAIDTYSKAVKMNPKSSLAHYYLGLAYLRSGDYENAEKEGEIAKKLGIQFTALYDELAKIKESPRQESDNAGQQPDTKIKKNSKKKTKEQLL